MTLTEMQNSQSKWPFSLRLNNYRYWMKFINWNNFILVEQYFCTNGHGFKREAKFTIIEKIEKDLNMKSIILKKWKNE